jgi:hypothetical protein
MRLRTPLRQISPKTAQWKRWRDKNYGLLGLRCHGICEGCRQPASLEPHHIVGREEEPYSSLRELLAGLCDGCHDSVTGVVGRGINVGLRARLASDGLHRLNEKYRLNAESLNQALRSMKKNYAWEPTRCEIVPR